MKAFFSEHSRHFCWPKAPKAGKEAKGRETSQGRVHFLKQAHLDLEGGLDTEDSKAALLTALAFGPTCLSISVHKSHISGSGDIENEGFLVLRDAIIDQFPVDLSGTKISTFPHTV